MNHESEMNHEPEMNHENDGENKHCDERKYSLIRLNKHVEKWKKLRASSFQRLVIAAAMCILSFGLGYYLYISDEDSIKLTMKRIVSTTVFGIGSIGVLVESLKSLKILFTKEKNEKNEKDEKNEKNNEGEKFDEHFVTKSINNCPKKLDSHEYSPLLFIKALIHHMHIMMIWRTIWVSLMSSAFIILSIIAIFSTIYDPDVFIFHRMALILICFSCFSLMEIITLTICITYYNPKLEEVDNGYIDTNTTDNEFTDEEMPELVDNLIKFIVARIYDKNVRYYYKNNIDYYEVMGILIIIKLMAKKLDNKVNSNYKDGSNNDDNYSMCVRVRALLISIRACIDVFHRNNMRPIMKTLKTLESMNLFKLNSHNSDSKLYISYLGKLDEKDCIGSNIKNDYKKIDIDINNTKKILGKADSILNNLSIGEEGYKYNNNFKKKVSKDTIEDEKHKKILSILSDIRDDCKLYNVNKILLEKLLEILKILKFDKSEDDEIKVDDNNLIEDDGNILEEILISIILWKIIAKENNKNNSNDAGRNFMSKPRVKYNFKPVNKIAGILLGLISKAENNKK
ncbi:hypothetical protein C2G38_999864 [Gigaspora rosea]|uniref:Uncharacterized protein n=1 Tax=Gigaspora rosea TaxID=44941 RepID=A0A397VIU0_9GLOM|nr:hypothetical protein C2G38_999864 [Gigaspora rosea]